MFAQTIAQVNAKATTSTTNQATKQQQWMSWTTDQKNDQYDPLLEMIVSNY